MDDEEEEDQQEQEQKLRQLILEAGSPSANQMFTTPDMAAAKSPQQPPARRPPHRVQSDPMDTMKSQFRISVGSSESSKEDLHQDNTFEGVIPMTVEAAPAIGNKTEVDNDNQNYPSKMNNTSASNKQQQQQKQKPKQRRRKLAERRQYAESCRLASSQLRLQFLSYKEIKKIFKDQDDENFYEFQEYYDDGVVQRPPPSPAATPNPPGDENSGGYNNNDNDNIILSSYNYKTTGSGGSSSSGTKKDKLAKEHHSSSMPTPSATSRSISGASFAGVTSGSAITIPENGLANSVDHFRSLTRFTTDYSSSSLDSCSQVNLNHNHNNHHSTSTSTSIALSASASSKPPARVSTTTTTATNNTSSASSASRREGKTNRPSPSYSNLRTLQRLLPSSLINLPAWRDSSGKPTKGRQHFMAAVASMPTKEQPVVVRSETVEPSSTSGGGGNATTSIGKSENSPSRFRFFTSSAWHSAGSTAMEQPKSDYANSRGNDGQQRQSQHQAAAPNSPALGVRSPGRQLVHSPQAFNSTINPTNKNTQTKTPSSLNKQLHPKPISSSSGSRVNLKMVPAAGRLRGHLSPSMERLAVIMREKRRLLTENFKPTPYCYACRVSFLCFPVPFFFKGKRLKRRKATCSLS